MIPPLKTKRKALRKLDQDLSLLMGWRWYIETKNAESRLYLLPEQNLYTEEEGGWVRWNGDQTPGIHRASSALATPEEIAKTRKYTDWDRGAAYFNPHSRLLSPRFMGVPHFSTDYKALEFLIEDMAKRRIDFTFSMMTSYKNANRDGPTLPTTRFIASWGRTIRSGQSLPEAIARIALSAYTCTPHLLATANTLVETESR